MASNTGIVDMMRMTVTRFYQTWQAICAVCERRNRQLREARDS